MRDLSAARSRPWTASSTVFESLPPATRYSLRGGSAVRAAVERAFGAPLPASACRAGVRGERAALWLGPDEWLLLAPEAHAASLAPALEAALADLPHSLVDVSHRQCAFCVAGPQAALVLAAGCPLDLDVAAFPPQMCTRTMLAKAEVVLWRTASEAFRLEVWRSFAAYVSQFLVEAGRGTI
ncbi:MAG TPA: sarcosine oxidase subunit gamma family protein [Steroidobacteraceae bacterium]|nr:sarcosine oxidase subunit gamma family protein [Steroidobacteraceae bacterium]